jgi:hypothetical protein
MATSVANPQASAPGPSPQGGGGGGDQQQANPLQETLGRLVLALRQLAQQNVVIQQELMQMASIGIQALQKVSQASSGPAVQPSAPPQQG